MAITLSEEGKEKLGADLKRKLDQYVADRIPVEQQWLKNLRQYRGKYDPDQEPPADRSQMYPKDTRVKVKGFVAKLMELMFPATENNWELTISPIPSIAQNDLQEIIFNLQQEAIREAMEELQEGMQEGEMPTAPPQPKPVTSQQIERAVREFAAERAKNMETEMLDQLADPEMDYPNLCKRVLRSGAIYGIGVLKGPLVRNQVERTWEPNELTGQYVAVEKVTPRPYYEFAKVWDIYPDLSARTWEEQEGIYERIVLNRSKLRKLGERPGFDKKALSKYLAEHSGGNYKAMSYESSLQQLNNQSTQSNSDNRKYEVYRWYGYYSAHDLKNAGVDVAESDMDKDILADVWFVDNVVLFADIAPFGDKPSDVYHGYVYSEDEDSSLVGVGMPEDLRDSQLGLCAATRAMYDNMAATAGPMLEVMVDQMKRGTDYKKIQAFKVFEREGDASETMNPAIRPITHPSHVVEILNIIKETRSQFDIESNIPSWTMGQTSQLGEAFRTSRNMSMLTGGANIVPKDSVRAFDRFTTSVMGSSLNWNMEFNEKEEIKGDFQVRAKGNLSLVAKEVRGAALDQFIQTLAPEERALLKTRKIMLERLRVRDLPVDILEDEETSKEILAGIQAKQADAERRSNAMQDLQAGKIQADTNAQNTKAKKEQELIAPMVLEILARIEKAENDTNQGSKKIQLDAVKTMLEQLAAGTSETEG